jgi:hypothetical protein
MENSIKEDIKILEGIIKGDEDCIDAIYSQMKVKNDNDEDIQYYKKEIQSIKNIVDNYLKEKARADKLEKEYSAMLTESDKNECDYKRVLKENEELKETYKSEKKMKNEYVKLYQDLLLKENVIPIQKIKDKIEEILNNGEYRIIFEGDAEFPDEATCIDAQKYIKLEKLQELLEGRK